MVLGLDVSLVAIEIDRQNSRLAAEPLGSRSLHMGRHDNLGWAAVLVNHDAGRCAGAFIEIIRYAVTVGIKRAAIHANLYTDRCTRTFVEIVGYTVTIGIQWTAIRVNLYTGRS